MDPWLPMDPDESVPAIDVARLPAIVGPDPAIDVDTILALHHDPDGFIGFVRKPDPDAPPRLDKDGRPYTFENLFAIKAGDVAAVLPGALDWLTHDAYMTVNDYYRAAWWKNTLTGLPDVAREEKYLRSLTACYVDIDCGRPGSNEPGAALPWRLAWNKATLLADAGIIPQPSMVAASGRGGYLLWFLCDPNDSAKLPHAWPEKVAFYKTCNRALGELLRTHELPADKKAIDAARVLRIPGSIHRKAQRRVGYVIQADEHGQGFVYTLPELAKALDIPALVADLPKEIRTFASGSATYRRQAVHPGTRPNGAEGPKAKNSKRAQDMVTISAWRGGYRECGEAYPDGSISWGRRKILALYALFLCGTKIDQATALDAVRSLAATMNPPWPDEPGDTTPEALTEAAYSGASKLGIWSGEKLCDVFGITAEMARELNLLSIIPNEVREERRLALPVKAEVIRKRRAWLKAYLDEYPNPTGGGRWSAQKVSDLLSPIAPYPWKNRETARQDMQAIGYIRRRK